MGVLKAPIGIMSPILIKLFMYGTIGLIGVFKEPVYIILKESGIMSLFNDPGTQCILGKDRRIFL